jgi:colanic acid biosynthesis glycosyl transferase WcaI
MNAVNSRPLRVLIVFEYGQPASDRMTGSLIKSLKTRLPGLQISCVHGIFSKYRPGGLHPERLVNFAWTYLCVAIRLLFSRPDAVLVRSAPPGVQLWTVWWARLRGAPTFYWLMDYHPEMEARQLEKCGQAWAARLLRRIDSALMPRFASIIALDPAMVRFARTRAGDVEVLEHPTWESNGTSTLTPVSYQPGGGSRPLRIAYSGNLGVAHDLTTFSALLGKLVRQRPIQLFVIGASAGGEERFQKLASEHGVAIETHPRVPFANLLQLYNRWQIDVGLVLLSDESSGLVSPSKFSAYINFCLPLIYVGPPGTNTAEVCTKFRGGFQLANGADRTEIAAVAEKLLDARQMIEAANGARAAAAHFTALNSESLADLLAPRFCRSLE